MKMESSACPSCGQEVVRGGGHGDNLNLGFSYVYCLECDKFLQWDGFGMVPDAEETTQHWVRARLLDTYGHKPQQD